MRAGAIKWPGWLRGIGPALLLAVLASCGAEGRSDRGSDALHLGLSGERALEEVARLVAFGPRPPGSEALEASRRHLEQTLASLGWATARQEFRDQTPIGRVLFVNLRARFAGSPAAVASADAQAVWNRPVRVLFGSHYDTKFYRRIHFVGANDAGSSSGLLVEMARVLAGHPEAASQVELVFFDGEEAYVNYTPTDGLFGSRYYAKWLRTQPAELQPKFAVIFDMVGDADLRITLPTNVSPEMAGWVFESASALGFRDHFSSRGGPIIDDHVPLDQIGIDVVNLIDLDYPPWHTPEDTMDKLSAESLQIVGSTGLYLLENYLLGVSP